MTQPEWRVRQARLIAAEVKRHRQRLGWTAQELADRTEALGHAISRNAIANLESYRRDIVTTADLAVLAAALNIPPVTLMFPVGRVDTVEVLPGDERPAWDALTWHTGESSDGRDDAVRLFRDHAGLVLEWRQQRGHLAALASTSSPDTADDDRFLMAAERQALLRTERAIGGQRRTIRDLGLAPPPLPAELAHLDHPLDDQGGAP